MRMSKVTPQASEDGHVSLRDYIDALFAERERLSGVRLDGIEATFRMYEKSITTALVTRDKAMSAAFAASEKAIDKAEAAQREYNARSNEFRGQLDDQAKLLMQRTEALGRFGEIERRLQEVELNKLNIPAHDGLEKRIQAVELHKANADKMESMQVYFERQLESQRQAVMLAIEKNQADIVGLRESRSQQSGRTTGMTALWGYFVGAAGILLSAAGILLIIFR